MHKCTHCGVVAVVYPIDRSYLQAFQDFEQLLLRSPAIIVLSGLVQIWRRTSIITTVWNYVYDHLLCDILLPGEAFIDFIAVSEKARCVTAHCTQHKLYLQCFMSP